MWLRHALKLLISIIVFSACSPSDRQQVDKLNSLSYAYHYCNIDSTEYYARQVLSLSDDADVRAEALNNLAFVSIIRMDYDRAQRQLDSIAALTDNQLELLVADIQQMRLCQRRSRNREFYDYRERALQALARLNEDLEELDERQQLRLVYAESEQAIVTSTYYYYVGLERQSSETLLAVNTDAVKRDTAQFLNYLYNIGAGGVLTEGTQEEINQQEFDHLLRCFQIASQHGYPFFAANAVEAIAEHLADGDARQQLIADNAAGMWLVNPEGVGDDELPLWLADNALATFREYGDVYQVAGAYRTLASCHRAVGDYESALFNLEQALADSVIYQAPDLVASIYEQLSVAYAAVNDKHGSDTYRNLYLDLQEQTRQDRQLEARADQLDHTVRQLNWILLAVLASIVLLLFLLWLFNHLSKKERTNSALDDLLEERREELAVKRLHVEKAERTNLEQRAKVSLVNTITPLIDRMLHAVRHLDNADSKANDERLDYIRELTGKIESDNELLTEWIQLRQGEVSLHIESFTVQSVFDIVARSKTSFRLKGLTLDVVATPAVVKADRTLTLFMINTLADNARKFTHEGGVVTVSATETDDYVEIAVADTGVGMTEEQLAHAFDRTTVVDETAIGRKDTSGVVQQSHGFGLLNCKGIIEKYRKMSKIFAVCTIQAESHKGKGSRFFFRLPKGRMLSVAGLVSLIGPIGLMGHLGLMGLIGLVPVAAVAQQLTPLDRAAIYVDSAYFSNINGTYERTLLFADSCRYFLNEHYRWQRPQGRALLKSEGDTSVTPSEIVWLRDAVEVNWSVLLDMRNESAVAALALHRWQLYQYNNRIYTQLFKELSADDSLEDYCRTMQRSRTNRTIALILLLMALVAIIPAYYFLYLRHRLYRRYLAERQQREQLEQLDDDIRRADLEEQNLHVANAVLDNCLSALKHETMYYPSRIRQLVDQGDKESLPEVAAYYRELYGLLSCQAMSQVERSKLRLADIPPSVLQLPPSAGHILGDEVLLRYLMEILKRQTGKRSVDFECVRRDDRYVVLSLTAAGVAGGTDIDRLVCRQILRDHGEATHRRACSIIEEHGDDKTSIIITLPAYGKLQGNNS